MSFRLTSPVFRANEPIPTRYTCDGENISPSLAWEDVPAGTDAFVLVVDDPDAPQGAFTHWVLADLPAGTRSLPEGVAPSSRPQPGGVHGRNDFGHIGYGGPCPPPGAPHRYRFSLYALDAALGVQPGVSRQTVLRALAGHVIGETQLVGTYQRGGRHR